MIIKKKNFNLTPGYRGKWPFSVPEVGIWRDDKSKNGELEIAVLKKSLSPFFKYLDFKVEAINQEAVGQA